MSKNARDEITGKANRDRAARAEKKQRRQIESNKEEVGNFVKEGEANYKKRIAENKRAYGEVEERLRQAYDAEDKAAIERLENQKRNIEAQFNDLQREIESGESSANEILADGDVALQEFAEGADARSAQAIDQAGNAQGTIDGNREVIDGMAQDLIAQDGPEGLDAAQSEIESNYRDAEAKLRRRKGGNLSPAELLSLEMNKSRDLGDNSRDMRQDWAENKENRVGNLLNLSNSSAAQSFNIGASGRNEQANNDQLKLTNQQVHNNTKLSSGERFLDRKLQNVENFGNQNLAVQDSYDAYKQSRPMNEANAFNSVGLSRSGADLAALDQLEALKGNALGLNMSQNNLLAQMYGNKAAHYTAGSNGLLPQIGSLVGKVGGAFVGAKTGDPSAAAGSVG